MNIVVTGGTGLIGSSLIPQLITQGHDVTELRRYTATRGLTSHPHKVIWFDMHDGRVNAELPTPDIIINLAAMASNAIANLNPTECFDINATGVLRLLYAFRHAPEAVIIQASSSEVYAKPSEVYALNPYAASKIAAEEIVRSSGHPFVIMRPFNTYGRATVGSPVSVVDKWCLAALNGEPIYTGDMETVRDFMFRTDHVDAYLSVIAAIERKDDIFGQTFDFGTGVGVSLGGLLGAIKVEVGTWRSFNGREREVIIEEGYARKNDVPVLIASPERTESLLAWKARVNILEGVHAAMLEWNTKHAA